MTPSKRLLEGTELLNPATAAAEGVGTGIGIGIEDERREEE